MNTFSLIEVDENLEIGMSGPPLEHGPLPALFYFALSARDSLTLDPFNQPVIHLLNIGKMRVFSITLPFHEPPREPQDALTHWAQSFLDHHDILDPFLTSAVSAIEKIASAGYTSSHKIGVAGLSRGAFIASHVAARSPLVHSVLGFAPLTQLHKTKEFASLTDDPRVMSYSISHQIPQLVGKNLRFYMGNRDERVGTARCFSFIQNLTEHSYQNKIRSPQVELILYPSIGFLGHGTPQAIFENGAEWILKQLGGRHV